MTTLAANSSSAPLWPTAAPVRRIHDYLFADPDLVLWAVLDGASTPQLLDAIFEHGVEHACLYSGELEPDMAEVAPYVVRIEPDEPFTRWLLSQGWGQSWGIFAATTAATDLRLLRRHLRGLLTVYSPEGAPLYFRYYDPRVLRVYLPTCNSVETRLVFGLVQQFAMEDEDPAVMLRFRPEGALPAMESLVLVRER